MVNLGTRNALCATNDFFIEVGQYVARGDDGLLRAAREGESAIGIAMEAVGPKWNLLITEEW